MTNQIDSPDGVPRKDPSRASPTLVQTDTAADLAVKQDALRRSSQQADTPKIPDPQSKKPK
ncbi:hypothetical protein [Acidovorax sp. BL-A-41-H1]|uniref:hypothetical protein n=1 Tax=Acidovorax sp. BL-A-41-H1 TaxID=3421102 RepID=UPI003F78DD85